MSPVLTGHPERVQRGSVNFLLTHRGHAGATTFLPPRAWVAKLNRPHEQQPGKREGSHEMKKYLILAAMGGALAATSAIAPAQAGGFSLTISNGNGGGIVFANGKAHHYNSYDRGWHRTDFYHQARKAHGGQGKNFLYIPGVVKKIQQRTGSKVTDIVFRNGVYHVKGYGPRGGFNQAKADPYTGRLFDVSRAHKTEPTPKRALGIRKLLSNLRHEGFKKFDRVDLKGHVYKVRGLNRRGRPVLITADSRTGHIENVQKAKRYNLHAKAAPQRKPFKHWTGGLKKHNYSHFSGATYVAGGNDWSDHYRVKARHGKRNVDLRICAYTGNVLGYRYL